MEVIIFMGAKTTITWTDASWNPVTGCTRVSPACDHCYAEEMIRRFRETCQRFKNGFKVTLHEDLLWEPTKWRQPRRVFVVSMGDLFHDDVPDDFLIQVFQIMRHTPRHTFQLLTKRPDRILQIEKHPDFPGWMQNIWMGVTVESPDYYWRIDRLRACGAGTKYISAEPLLASIADIDLTGIDWIIVAGESGRGARLMHEAWVDEVIAAADHYSAALHVKQMGSAWARVNGYQGKAHDLDQWPARFRRREWPSQNNSDEAK
jgi:protein gp37